MLLLGLAACGSSGGGQAGDLGKAAYEDPFASQPDESAGLINVTTELDALLEHGALETACAQYRAGMTDRHTMLLCGKWMFFYETFGTVGIPSAIVKFAAMNFPDELGHGFSKLGMVPDPTSPDFLPLGLAKTAPINGTIESLAFTCASCHFGQLPDGRFAVGAPNHRYDYGKHILSLTLLPTLGVGFGANPADHDPTAVAAMQPALDKLAGDAGLRAKLGLALLPLVGIKQPVIAKEVEHAYATWPTGTLDFVVAPLPIDDNVLIVGKMIGLWGIPRHEESMARGMTTALLGWGGQARGLDEFIKGFAALGDVHTPPTDADILPLLEFIYSLRAPTNPVPPDAAQVQVGAELFVTKQCVDCHDGPRGSGKRAYTFAEIGTDPTLERWADPDLDGNACCGLNSTLTHGVKSPRLVGEWALKRFLHNGSLSTLEQLFCLDGGRPAVGDAPMRSDGHAFSCDGLAEDEKRALIAYLRAH